MNKETEINKKKWEEILQSSDETTQLDNDSNKSSQQSSPLEEETVTEQLTHPSHKELEALLTAAEMKAQAAEAKEREYFNKLIRNQADIENLHRQKEREVKNAHKFALQQFLVRLLPVVDNLERSLLSDNDETLSIKSLREGVALTLKLLQECISNAGVQIINPVHQPFDPNYHEAMTTEESTEFTPNTVLKVLQPGYLLHERLIRPALVIVTKAVEEKPSST